MDKRQKTALISVYNKDGIADFAKELVGLGWKIISSGGTSKALKDAGVELTELTEVTGFPPILDHRVLTLSPKIHGGLLALDKPEHHEELKKYDIPWIDLVCVDLYPLEEEVRKANATAESVIEKTDMGGVALLRSSAKGRRITVCLPSQRTEVIEWLKNGELDKENFLNKLAAKADAVVANYSLTSARYHSGGEFDGYVGQEVAKCKYGENAWQVPAGMYTDMSGVDDFSPTSFKLIAGTSPSYNNFADLDRLLQTVTHIVAGFDKNFGKVPNIAVGVKHGNACGAAVGENPKEVIEKMLDGDLRAIFGGVVMVNFPINEELAETLLSYKVTTGRRLLDTVIAPSFSEGAVEMMKRKGDKCRFLVNENLNNLSEKSLDYHNRFRYVRGGFLKQPNYTFLPSIALAKEGVPQLSESVMKDVILAWAVGSTSNSNTITLVKGGQLLGNGVGQQDRVGAAKLALLRADDAQASLDIFSQSLGSEHSSATPSKKHTSEADLEGATAYSDSFFPFPDAPEALIARGIKTIFSTSGSVNDEKIIELCKNKGVELILLPDTEARGFYQH